MITSPEHSSVVPPPPLSIPQLPTELLLQLVRLLDKSHIKLLRCLSREWAYNPVFTQLLFRRVAFLPQKPALKNFLLTFRRSPIRDIIVQLDLYVIPYWLCSWNIDRLSYIDQQDQLRYEYLATNGLLPHVDVGALVKEKEEVERQRALDHYQLTYVPPLIELFSLLSNLKKITMIDQIYGRGLPKHTMTVNMNAHYLRNRSEKPDHGFSQELNNSTFVFSPEGGFHTCFETLHHGEHTLDPFRCYFSERGCGTKVWFHQALPATMCLALSYSSACVEHLDIEFVGDEELMLSKWWSENETSLDKWIRDCIRTRTDVCSKDNISLLNLNRFTTDGAAFLNRVDLKHATNSTLRNIKIINISFESQNDLDEVPVCRLSFLKPMTNTERLAIKWDSNISDDKLRFYNHGIPSCLENIYQISKQPLFPKLQDLRLEQVRCRAHELGHLLQFHCPSLKHLFLADICFPHAYPEPPDCWVAFLKRLKRTGSPNNLTLNLRGFICNSAFRYAKKATQHWHLYDFEVEIQDEWTNASNIGPNTLDCLLVRTLKWFNATDTDDPACPLNPWELELDPKNQWTTRCPSIDVSGTMVGHANIPLAPDDITWRSKASCLDIDD